MSENVTECKTREVIPDLLNSIGKTKETMKGIWRSIEKLETALHGSRPVNPDGLDKLSKEEGSLESLERVSRELHTSVNDADLELRKLLHELLGDS